jgi:hypothetical protein
MEYVKGSKVELVTVMLSVKMLLLSARNLAEK